MLEFILVYFSYLLDDLKPLSRVEGIAETSSLRDCMSARWLWTDDIVLGSVRFAYVCYTTIERCLFPCSDVSRSIELLGSSTSQGPFSITMIASSCLFTCQLR